MIFILSKINECRYGYLLVVWPKCWHLLPKMGRTTKVGARERVSIQLSDGRTTPTLPADLRPIFLVEAADNSIVRTLIDKLYDCWWPPPATFIDLLWGKHQVSSFCYQMSAKGCLFMLWGKGCMYDSRRNSGLFINKVKWCFTLESAHFPPTNIYNFLRDYTRYL